LKIFALILKKNLINLSILDIIFFSLFININYFFSLSEIVKIYISVYIIHKTILNYSYTKFIELVFFISGTKVKKLVLINFFMNNFFFLIISLFLGILKITTFQVISKNFFILNSLMVISFFLKFIISFQNINNSFFRKILITILFYFLFGIITIFLNFPLLGSFIVLIIFALLINYFNRTLNLNDIN